MLFAAKAAIKHRKMRTQSIGDFFQSTTVEISLLCKFIDCGYILSPRKPGEHINKVSERVNMNLRNRYRGSLLGLAAGDALGTAVEFKKPGSLTPVTAITGGGSFNLRPGE